MCGCGVGALCSSVKISALIQLPNLWADIYNAASGDIYSLSSRESVVAL